MQPRQPRQPQRRDDFLYEFKGGSLRSPPAPSCGRPRAAVLARHPPIQRARAQTPRPPRPRPAARPRCSVVDAYAASSTPLRRCVAQPGARAPVDGLADQHRGEGQRWTWPSRYGRRCEHRGAGDWAPVVQGKECTDTVLAHPARAVRAQPPPGTQGPRPTHGIGTRRVHPRRADGQRRAMSPSDLWLATAVLRPSVPLISVPPSPPKE
jgi:hypothetical protein